MTQLSYANDQHAIRVAKTLAVLAIVAALTAAAAGVVLLIAEPDSGSTLESTLGVTAAIAGLSTAVFAIAGLIYAQVKNLWQYAPTWIRTAAWTLLAAAAVFSIIRSVIESN